MDANQTIRDLTIAYIENALTEVALLHDEELIEPMLEKFHIERHYARFHGFAPKPGKFNPRAGLKPRPVYTVTDANGTPLGDPIHEGDLGAWYAEAVIERQIAANLEAMLADHADLVALHRAGDGGAAPSFRYKPASSLAQRTDTEAALERQKTILRTQIEKLHDEQQSSSMVRKKGSRIDCIWRIPQPLWRGRRCHGVDGCRQEPQPNGMPKLPVRQVLCTLPYPI